MKLFNIKNCFEDELINIIRQKCLDIIKSIQLYAKLSDEVILWLDCDRESKAIACDPIDICFEENPILKFHLGQFYAISKSEILKVINNLREPNQFFANAVKIRNVMDLRSGFAFTKF